MRFVSEDKKFASQKMCAAWQQIVSLLYAFCSSTHPTGHGYVDQPVVKKQDLYFGPEHPKGQKRPTSYFFERVSGSNFS